jgi:AcrR family transcriptional regulator
MGIDRQAWLRRATQHKILLAAESRFSADGFEGARVDDIATEAQVSKSHLYYHFSSKDELLSALIELRLADVLSAKDAVFDGLDWAAAMRQPEGLQPLMTELIDAVLRPHHRFIRIVLVESIRNPAAAAPVLAAVAALLDDTLHRIRNAGFEVPDEAEAKAVWFYFGLIPTLFHVAVDPAVTEHLGSSASLAGTLARLQRIFLNEFPRRP